MAIEEKAFGGRSLAKDFYRLMKNIDGMSGGQARLAGWDEANLKHGITVSVVPDSGMYEDGEFMFQIACNNKYPEASPDVYCKTMVYHPNIDNIEGDGGICLNLLDDDIWSPSMTLEDVVQGILFLMHNPNLDDPLCVMFSPGMDEDEFAANVRQSLDGGLVDGYEFERNRVVKEVAGACKEDVGEATTDIVGEATTENVGGANTEIVGGANTEIMGGANTEIVGGANTDNMGGATSDVGVTSTKIVGGAAAENVGGATTDIGVTSTKIVGGAATDVGGAATDVGGAATDVDGVTTDVGGATIENVGGETVQDVEGATENEEAAVNCGAEITRELTDNSIPTNNVAENKDRRGTHEQRKIGTSDKNVTGRESGFHWDGLRKKIVQDFFYLKEKLWFS